MLWTVDIDTAAMISLSASISNEYLEFKDSPGSFTFTWGTPKRTHKLLTDKDLRDLLCRLVAHNEMNVWVAVVTPGKAFSDWTLKEAWELLPHRGG